MDLQTKLSFVLNNKEVLDKDDDINIVFKNVSGGTVYFQVYQLCLSSGKRISINKEVHELKTDYVWKKTGKAFISLSFSPDCDK